MCLFVFCFFIAFIFFQIKVDCIIIKGYCEFTVPNFFFLFDGKRHGLISLSVYCLSFVPPLVKFTFYSLSQEIYTKGWEHLPWTFVTIAGVSIWRPTFASCSGDSSNFGFHLIFCFIDRWGIDGVNLFGSDTSNNKDLTWVLILSYSIQKYFFAIHI